MATRKTPLRPDVKGRYRPQIGWRDAAHSSQVRFNLGSVETVSGAEAQRRADEIRKLFDAQCEQRQISHWGGDELEVAQAIARGVPYVFEFSDLAKSMPEAAFKEALIMDSFRRYGAGEIQPSDPETFDAALVRLRTFVVKELEEFKSKERARWGDLYDQAGMPEDLLNGELAVLGDAIDKYVAEDIETNGAKLDDGLTLTPGMRKRRFLIDQVRSRFGAVALAKLDWDTCQTVVRHWGNRPKTKRSDRCSLDHARSVIKEFVRFCRWLDHTDAFHWQLPRGFDRINRKVAKLPRDKQTSPVAIVGYSPEQLAVLVKEADDFGRLLIVLGLNCAFGWAELGQVQIENFQLRSKHPHWKRLGLEATDEHSWLFFNRPKTGVYGEWLLWPETVSLIENAIKRSKRLRATKGLLCCDEDGLPIYRKECKCPQRWGNNWWLQDPSGLRTKVLKANEGFPKLPFKTIRKTVPNELRHRYGSEFASLALCHGKADQTDDLLDLYANKPFGPFHKAMKEIRSLYTPIWNVLSGWTTSGPAQSK